MFRALLAAVSGLLLCAGSLAADEVKGKIKSVDPDKSTITVTIGDKDQEIKITDATKLLGPSGTDVKDGIKSKRLREGVQVTVTWEKKDDKDVCTKIQLVGQPKDPNAVIGKIKSVDAEKNLVIVTIEDKDRELKVTTETKLLGPSGKDLKDGINSQRLKQGVEVTVACKEKEGKEICTLIQLKGQKKNQ